MLIMLNDFKNLNSAAALLFNFVNKVYLFSNILTCQLVFLTVVGVKKHEYLNGS